MARYHYQVTLSGAQGGTFEDFDIDPGLSRFPANIGQTQ
jgi:hypothetical protein